MSLSNVTPPVQVKFDDSLISTAIESAAYTFLEPRESLVVAVRRTWMSQMGLDEDEIQEHCDLTQYPATLEEELSQLQALVRVRQLNQCP